MSSLYQISPNTFAIRAKVFDIMQLIRKQNTSHTKSVYIQKIIQFLINSRFYHLWIVPAPETIFMEDANKIKTGPNSIVNMLYPRLLYWILWKMMPDTEFNQVRATCYKTGRSSLQCRPHYMLWFYDSWFLQQSKHSYLKEDNEQTLTYKVCEYHHLVTFRR